MSENRLNIQRWNVAGALHRPKGIQRQAKVLNGHVNAIFSWSFGAMGIWLYPE